MAGRFGTRTDVLAVRQSLQHVHVNVFVVHNPSIASNGGWLTALLSTYIPYASVLRLQYDGTESNSSSSFERLSDLVFQYLDHTSRESNQVSNEVQLQSDMMWSVQCFTGMSALYQAQLRHQACDTLIYGGTIWPALFRPEPNKCSRPPLPLLV